MGDILIDDIEGNFRKFVHLEDIQETYVSPSDEKFDAEGSEELKPDGPEFVVKSLENSATVPFSEDDDHETALQVLFFEQPTSPLVSAMKGTREKLGASPRRLTVKWAPDVYDPIPNSLSHTVKGKQKKSRRDRDKDSNNYKKGGKKGQKGKSRAGAGGKDKKQLRKTGGKSDKSHKTPNNFEALADSSYDLNEFHLGSPDYCGSSFLKKSPTRFHYVAEAL